MVGDREIVWLGEREEEMARESDEKGGSKEGGRKRGKDRVRDEGERKRRREEDGINCGGVGNEEHAITVFQHTKSLPFCRPKQSEQSLASCQAQSSDGSTGAGRETARLP